MSEGRFAGRVALVTGGSSGIGAAVAERLRDEGARVASLDLTETAPEGVLPLAGDVRDSAEIESVFDRAEAELNKLVSVTP